jgi:hypothetical protein
MLLLPEGYLGKFVIALLFASVVTAREEIIISPVSIP